MPFKWKTKLKVDVVCVVSGPFNQKCLSCSKWMKTDSDESRKKSSENLKNNFRQRTSILLFLFCRCEVMSRKILVHLAMCWSDDTIARRQADLYFLYFSFFLSLSYFSIAWWLLLMHKNFIGVNIRQSMSVTVCVCSLVVGKLNGKYNLHFVRSVTWMKMFGTQNYFDIFECVWRHRRTGTVKGFGFFFFFGKVKMIFAECKRTTSLINEPNEWIDRRRGILLEFVVCVCQCFGATISVWWNEEEEKMPTAIAAMNLIKSTDKFVLTQLFFSSPLFASPGSGSLLRCRFVHFVGRFISFIFVRRWCRAIFRWFHFVSHKN